MATSKKNAKTNKTAHVLNMITGAQEIDESAAGGPALSARGAVAPILEVARANDDALSDTILDALTEELDAEKLVSASPDAAAPEPPQPAPEEARSAQEEALVTGEPRPAPTTPKSPQQFLQKAPSASSRGSVPSEYFNVIQAIVEERALNYMQMLDMCQCPRCQADVKALALSNLTPKYIVMERSQFTPMLSVYEGKYGAAITAQLISSCLVVKEHPRH